MSLLLLFGGGGGAPVPEDMSATTPTGISSLMVAGSMSYSATADFLTALTARSCRVKIVWYDGAGAAISTTTGSSVVDNTSTWVTATATATSPSTAVYAAVVVEVLAVDTGASEVHYVDKIGLFRGLTPVWVPHTA